MPESQKSRLVLHRAGLILGLTYSLFPVSLGLGELLWRPKDSGPAIQWMSAAAGIVFVSVALAYSQGFSAASEITEPGPKAKP